MSINFVNITDRQKLFKCKDCNKSFSRNYDLNLHQKYHTGDKPFKCEQCEKSFVLRCQLTKHFRTHTGEKPFQCEHCAKSFSQSGNLSKHLRTHTGERPYTCEHCKRSFSYISNFRTHLKIHFGERPYECKDCGKLFSRHSHLTKHKRTHSGEKPFKCQYCDMAFTQNYNLTTHLRTHTGERPFHCDCCEKAFSQRSSLTKHLRTHTGEKPYQCEICDRSFSQSSSLVKHMSKIHSAECAVYNFPESIFPIETRDNFSDLYRVKEEDPLDGSIDKQKACVASLDMSTSRQDVCNGQSNRLEKNLHDGLTKMSTSDKNFPEISSLPNRNFPDSPSKMSEDNMRNGSSGGGSLDRFSLKRTVQNCPLDMSIPKKRLYPRLLDRLYVKRKSCNGTSDTL